MPPLERAVLRPVSPARLLLLNPAWPATALCVWGSVEVSPRWWGPAGGLFAAVGVASAAAGTWWDPAARARAVARWLPAVWRLIAVPVAAWGLLMLPTCWFTLNGLFALVAAAVLAGYANDLSAAVRRRPG